jgi:hypothetical protein
VIRERDFTHRIASSIVRGAARAIVEAVRIVYKRRRAGSWGAEEWGAPESARSRVRLASTLQGT